MINAELEDNMADMISKQDAPIRHWHVTLIDELKQSGETEAAAAIDNLEMKAGLSGMAHSAKLNSISQPTFRNFPKPSAL